MAKKELLIPFLKGNQLHYPECWDRNATIEWSPNFIFRDTLEFVDYRRGRSAAYFLWRSRETGKEYTMFLKDLEELIHNCDLHKGVLHGTFTFCKRGMNYGIRLVDSDEHCVRIRSIDEKCKCVEQGKKDGVDYSCPVCDPGG